MSRCEWRGLRARRTERSLARKVAGGLGLVLAAAALVLAGDALAAGRVPPSPYDILRSGGLETPLLDAVPACIPDGLGADADPVLEAAAVGEWRDARQALSAWAEGLERPDPRLIVLDTVLRSRAAEDREDRIEIEDVLRTALRQKGIKPVALCLRLELARVLLLLTRDSEAVAQLVRAERLLDEPPSMEDSAATPGAVEISARGRNPHRDEIAFWRTEVQYRRGQSFEAHLAYRKLTKSKSARLALAARLRLTDLSFDSGKAEQVSVEYEQLLPRASAFGASTQGWARRAAEAALDAGDPTRALRWLERYLESGANRDDRDAAEIRLADLDVLFEDPLRARKRLSSVAGRRRNGPIGALAAIRAVDLGVFAGSPDQGMEILLAALRDQREGLRRYALGVLMAELAHRGDLDGAFAVATRLAYEGVDPVVTPDYDVQLGQLLGRISVRPSEEGGCREVVRALGGRYGILIERADSPEAFATVGACFEEMELPWLAVTVYRAITRRFGAAGAQSIALPLARSSLAIGEVPLARRVATAALQDPDEFALEWRAVLAEADYLEGRFDKAAEGLRLVLEAGVRASEEGRLARLLALTLDRRNERAEIDFLAERVPGWLAARDSEPAAQASLVEAAMLTAHAYRRAGRDKKAAALYRVVDSHAEPGALRSSARFWLGLAREPDAADENPWQEDPQVSLGAPWGRYALFEEHFDSLWSVYGGVVQRDSGGRDR